MAANVEMLKNRVPTNCTDVAHQSMRHGAQPRMRHERGRLGSSPAATGPAVAPTASRYWRKAALVKKIDPMK